MSQQPMKRYWVRERHIQDEDQYVRSQIEPMKLKLMVYAADMEAVEAAEAKRVKSYYDSRQGTLQRENAALREQLEQQEHALAAKEASEARVREALGKAREKLQIYRRESQGAYKGGMEYTALMQLIEAALQPSRGEQG